MQSNSCMRQNKFTYNSNLSTPTNQSSQKVHSLTQSYKLTNQKEQEAQINSIPVPYPTLTNRQDSLLLLNCKSRRHTRVRKVRQKKHNDTNIPTTKYESVLSHLSHRRSSVVDDGETSPPKLSLQNEDTFDLCSSPSRPTALLKLGLLRLCEYPPYPYASGTGKESRFFTEPVPRSRSGVAGLCLGALCDRARALADSVAAM